MKRIIPIAMCAVLAGCGAFSDLSSVDEGASVQKPATDLAAKPGAAGGDGEVRGGRGRGWRLELVPRPKRKPAGIGGIRPETLVGKTPEEIEALIGRPATMNDRPPATVWLYRTDRCALELFFYMDVGTKTFRALTFVLKNPNGPNASPSRCLGQIRAVAYGS